MIAHCLACICRPRRSDRSSTTRPRELACEPLHACWSWTKTRSTGLDPAGRRALRLRALRPADFLENDRGAARRAVDLYKKKKSSGSGEDLERQYGRTWIWTAIDAPTRLLITFWIGGRELDDARRMLKDLTVRSQGKPLFVSDELPHYGSVLGELFHKLVPPAPTGKPGRPRNPERIIDADLDYATVHKTRQGAQVIKVERR